MKTYALRSTALLTAGSCASVQSSIRGRCDGACQGRELRLFGNSLRWQRRNGPRGASVRLPQSIDTVSLSWLQVQVEDLFYNTPQRLRSLRSATDEYARIVSVVMAYSIHNAGIAMSCRKTAGGSSNSTADINTSVGASVLDNIGLHYGDTVKRELVHVEAASSELDVEVDAWCSGANFQAKKSTFLFFINRESEDRRGCRASCMKVCSRQDRSYRPLRRLFLAQTSSRGLLRHLARQGDSPVRLPLARNRSDQGRRQCPSDQEGGRVCRRGRRRRARV